MAKRENQKKKLIRLLEILVRETDAEHGLSMNEIISRLEEYGIAAERKSIYDDFMTLEELGFVGGLFIILLFVLLVWRGFVIAFHSRDKFGALLVIGIVSRVAVQTILNIAVVTNTLPSTGISLPFFSYGGTALVILLAEMGVVLSVSRFSYMEKT